MTDASEATQDSTEGEEGRRQRSTIGFPYMPLAESETLALAIHENAGSGSCTVDQLAAWTSASPKSSSFRMNLAAARLFGVIESEGGDGYRLSALGRQLVDPKTTRKARADAFLNVPLYKALFENYKGGVVPPSPALERDIVRLGVGDKQKERARQVFERSSEHAGYNEHGKNRLIYPAIKSDTVVEDNTGTSNVKGNDAAGAVRTEALALDPLLMALLRKIPSPGESWPADRRLRWFRTFAMNVSQVFDDDESAVELDIKLRVGEKDQA